MRGEASVFELEFWKSKSNQFFVKVVSGSECDGIEMKCAIYK